MRLPYSDAIDGFVVAARGLVAYRVYGAVSLLTRRAHQAAVSWRLDRDM